MATRKRTAAQRKAASLRRKKKTPATVTKGTLNRWTPAKRVRVRKVKGKLLVDVER